MRSLTRRQMQIVKLLAEGIRYKEIGERLNVGEQAVKKMVARVLRRTGLPTAQAALAMVALNRHRTPRFCPRCGVKLDVGEAHGA